LACYEKRGDSSDAGGLANVGNYLATLRGYLRTEGFDEPDLLFFTNDSPFALQSGLLLLHDVLLHDHATKLPYGVPGLDLYPKQSGTPALQDQPFQTDFFVRYSDQYPTGGQSHAGYAYAAELQGGFFAPFGTAPPPVLPEATDQLLLRAVGRGLKGGSFYVLRGGINADNSDYDYQAAIGLDGGLRPRWGVMEKWAAFLKAYGPDLLSAHPMQPAVAILTNAHYAAPQGGVADEMQLLHTAEEPALFGWLASAGLDPAVLEAQAVSGSDLAKYKVLFYQNPDYIDDTTANLLSAFVAEGGLLVNLLWPGAASADFRTSPAQLAYADLWSTAPDGRYQAWLPYSVTGTGPLKLAFGADTLSLTSYWYETFWQPPAGAVPFAWEQPARGQGNGRVVGYTLRDGKGTRAFLGTNIYSVFNRGDYYKMPVSDLTALNRLARWLVQPSGVEPIVKTDTEQVLAWPRRSASGRTFIFVVNDGAARTTTISINATAIGLSAGQSYHLKEALGGVDLGLATGAALGASGVTLSLPHWGTAVVVVEPASP
jgi:hypothetical protein